MGESYNINMVLLIRPMTNTIAPYMGNNSYARSGCVLMIRVWLFRIMFEFVAKMSSLREEYLPKSSLLRLGFFMCPLRIWFIFLSPSVIFMSLTFVEYTDY